MNTWKSFLILLLASLIFFGCVKKEVEIKSRTKVPEPCKKIDQNPGIDVDPFEGDTKKVVVVAADLDNYLTTLHYCNKLFIETNS